MVCKTSPCLIGKSSGIEQRAQTFELVKASSEAAYYIYVGCQGPRLLALVKQYSQVLDCRLPWKCTAFDGMVMASAYQTIIIWCV